MYAVWLALDHEYTQVQAREQITAKIQAHATAKGRGER